MPHARVCVHVRRRAFTLIEVLVVIGIIALLMGILLPSLGKARRQALDTVGNANLRSLAQLMTMYNDDHKGAFPNPFGQGDTLENDADLLIPDFNDAVFNHSNGEGSWWNFNACPACSLTTEFFSPYWYSHLALEQDAPMAREEQFSPADGSLVQMWRGQAESGKNMDQSMLWPSSFYLSPTVWSLPGRYPGGIRFSADAEMIKTQYVETVAFPSEKVILFERADFAQRSRIQVNQLGEALNVGAPPAWNNLRSETNVVTADGAVRLVKMKELYQAIDETKDLRPCGEIALGDDPTVSVAESYRNSFPSNQAGLGDRGHSTDETYPAFFWATKDGIRGRDLPR